MELFLASIIQGALAFFINGGFFMAILLVVSVVAGTVIVLRSAALRERSILPPPLADEIERFNRETISTSSSDLFRVIPRLWHAS